MKIDPAPTHLDIKQSGNPIQLFMSYGLLNRLAVIVGGPDQAPMLAGSPELQKKVLLEVFTKRAKGQILDQPDSLDDIEVSIEDMGNILDWVNINITDFFLRMTEKTLLQTQKAATRMSSLQSTVNGISASQLKMPAA